MEEERGRALLAAMLGYFRQEEKNEWWEHYRLRALPSDKQLDKREMLAGLEFLEVMPKQPRERSPRWRFRFPAQETAVGVGDTVYFTEADEPSPATETSASVVEFDLGARSVVLRMSQATGDRRPTAVFRNRTLDKRPLEHALLRLAEHFRDQGFSTDGPFAAASATYCCGGSRAEARLVEPRCRGRRNPYWLH